MAIEQMKLFFFFFFEIGFGSVLELELSSCQIGSGSVMELIHVYDGVLLFS